MNQAEQAARKVFENAAKQKPRCRKERMKEDLERIWRVVAEIVADSPASYNRASYGCTLRYPNTT